MIEWMLSGCMLSGRVDVEWVLNDRVVVEWVRIE